MNTTHKDLTEQIALFRHGLIARVLPADLTPRQRQQEMQRISGEQHQIPGSLRTRVAYSTLREWVKLYRDGGFDALKPRKRGDSGHPRALAPELAERLLQRKEAEPDLSIRLIIQQLRDEGVIGKDQRVPISTVHRLFKSHGVMSPRSQRDGGAVEDRRRFAYVEAGQLWMSDVMHGPSVPGPDGKRKKKTYLIAFIDDATRVIPHAQFAFAENTREFLPVFKVALLKRGLPQRLFVDNGANYRSRHFSIVCAKLGVALIHSRPFQPQGKGKIERFFRTVRAQLLTRLDNEDLSSLSALNRRLAAWVEGEYHHNPHRGIEGDTPLDRWARVGGSVRYPEADMDLDDLFLFEEIRKVQNDRIVSLHGRLFEVDATLVGEKVTLRYDPARPDAAVQVVHNGQTIEKARQVDIYANCSVKRQRRGGAINTDKSPQVPAGLSMSALRKSDSGNTDGNQGGNGSCI
ncbi:MAG: helix-turn-helix domain-containing protein [Granulosicoccus sp.]